MASETSYRGLTIRIGGDVTKLTKALTTANRAITATQGQLKRLNQATKLDPGNTDLMASRLDLVRRKALEVASRMAVLSRAVEDVGRSKSGGTTIAELAAKTDDAALEASKARDKYNELNSELATFYATAKKATGIDLHADEHRGNLDSWNEVTSSLRKQLDEGEFGEKTAKIRALVENAQRFRSVWHEVASELNEKNTVARFVDLTNELQRSEAEVAALGREMADLRLDDSASDRVKALDRELDELGASADVASGYMRHLDDALKLDPGNTDLVERKIALLASQSEIAKERVSALEAKMDALGADARDLAASKGIVELAQGAAKARENFQNATAKVQLLSRKLDEAKKHVEDLEKSGTGTAREYDAAYTSVSMLERELNEAEREQEEFYEDAVRLKNAHTYAELAQESDTAKANISACAREQKKLNDSIHFSTNDFLEISNRLSNIITPALRRLGSYSIRQADTVDSAFRDMAKTVNATDEELEALREHAQEFSTTHFTSADQMLEIMAMGGQLGIAAENLEAFGDVASSLEIATNMGSASEIAQTLGQMAAIMDDLQDENGDLDVDALTGYADAITRLGNNMPALESDISSISQRLASQANILGMTTPEVLAWSTALAATGQKSEAAGTALAKTFTMIELAVGSATGGMQEYADMVGMSVDEFMAALQEAPEQFSELAEEMGVETDELASSILDAGSKLEGFADVAGMTADQFAAMWANDPSAALQAFIEGLAKIDAEGGSIDAVLDNLGIKSVRQKQAIEGLSQTIDILGDALIMSQDAWDGVSDQWGDAGDAAREADRKAQGFSGTLQELKNTAQVLGSEVGESLLPFLRDALDALKDLYDWYSGMSDSQQTTATVFGGVIAAAPIAIAAVLKFKEAAEDATKWQGKLVGKSADLINAVGIGNIAKGGALGIALAAIAWSAHDAYDQHRKFNRVVEDLPSIIGRATGPVHTLASGFDDVADSTENAFIGYRDYIDLMAQHVDNIEETVEAYEAQAGKLELAQDYLHRYMNETNLSEEEQGRLQWAVHTVNEELGTELTVVDQVNGKIEDQNGVIQSNIDKIDELIEAKKREARMQMLTATYEELYQAQADAMAEVQQIQDQMSTFEGVEGAFGFTVTGQDELNAALSSAMEQLDAVNGQLANVEEQMALVEGAAESGAGAYEMWALGWSGMFSDEMLDDLMSLAGELDNLGVHLEDLGNLNSEQVNMLVSKWSSGEMDLRDILTELGVAYEDHGLGLTRSMGKASDDAIKAYKGKMAELPGQVATETRKVKTKLEEGLNQERNASIWASRTMSAYRSALTTNINVSGVKSALQQLDMSDKAYTWGVHLIDNLSAGIEARLNKLSGSAAKAAKTVSSYLHQTVADVGPLSDTDVWGVHLMDNIINGIESRQSALERASLASADIIADAMDVESRLSVPTMLDAPVSSLQGVIQGGNSVFINGAQINDTPAIQEATKVYLMDMARLGAM